MAEKDNIAAEIRESGYDVGVTSEPGTATIIPPQHTDKTGGVKEKSDLSRRTRILLGQYLGASTKDNYYPVAAGEREVGLSTANGKPASLDKNPNAGQTFVSEIVQEMKSTSDAFDSTGTGTSSNSRPFSSYLKKGNQDKPANFTGNNLLRQGEAAIKDNYTSAVLKSNRFTRSAAYFQNLRDPGDVDRDLGYYSRPPIGEARVQATPGSKSVTSDAMGKVGQVLMLRATGELDSNSRNFNPQANVGALLPGSVQILPVQLINSRDLEARDVLEAMINEEVGSKTPGPDTKSWGQLNNHLEPFTGVIPAGMVALCIALILAIQVSLELLGTLLGLIPEKPMSYTDSKGRYFKGKSRSSEPGGGASDKGPFGGISIGGATDIKSLLGLRDTVNTYTDSFKKGMDVFFGRSGGSSQSILSKIADSAGSAFKKAMESPGFYVVFCRSIIRSGYGIGKKLSELGSNPLSIVQGILNVIEDLRSSKIVAAYNMFAQLGDLALLEEIPLNINDIDKIPDEAPAVMKSRYTDSRALAWRSSAAPSLYLLPQNFIAGSAIGDKKINVFWDPAAAYVGKDDKEMRRGANVHMPSDGSNRISSELAKRFEDRLEGEYVPFYFQDMRTNEIVSFHAFLTSLNEDYTPNWENVEAYGRVDPIRIYKNTTRRLNLSFRIVALDSNDFDAMWYKINKIITLVFPQWSKGKKLVVADKNIEFRQPFSQTISSSPLIRLRIGDLVRSNYSRFSLLRMFEVRESEEAKQTKASITAKLQDIVNSVDAFIKGQASKEQKEKIVAAFKDKTIEAYVDKTDRVVLNPKNEGAAASALSGLASAAASAVGVKSNSTKKNNSPKILQPLKVKEIKSISENTAIVDVDDEGFKKSYKTSTIGVDAVSSLRFKWSNVMTPKYFEGLKSPADINATIKDFVDPAKNPIVRYFENNTFRGLAGTIDSLNFSWLDENLWEIDIGSRAPKSCVVTISFTPIHDIAPGLDADGFNRAPVYRVGNQIAAITDKTEFDQIKPRPIHPDANGADSKGDSLTAKLPLSLKIP